MHSEIANGILIYRGQYSQNRPIPILVYGQQDYLIFSTHNLLFLYFRLIRQMYKVADQEYRQEEISLKNKLEDLRRTHKISEDKEKFEFEDLRKDATYAANEAERLRAIAIEKGHAVLQRSKENPFFRSNDIFGQFKKFWYKLFYGYLPVGDYKDLDDMDGL